jgi:hypothetical protein
MQNLDLTWVAGGVPGDDNCSNEKEGVRFSSDAFFLGIQQ